MRSVFAGAVALSIGLVGTASGAVYQLTGGDAGEGLTLNPSAVVGAWNINGSGQTVQGVSFVSESDSSNVYLAKFATDGHVDYSYGFSFAGSQTSTDDASLRNVINPGQYFYASNYGDASKITLSGLTPSTQYKVEVLATGGGRTMQVGYNAEAGITPVETQLMASGVAYNFSNLVQSRSDGKMYINFAVTSGSNNPVVSGLVISAVPEPAAMGVLGLGAFLIGQRRRRSHA